MQFSTEALANARNWDLIKNKTFLIKKSVVKTDGLLLKRIFGMSPIKILRPTIYSCCESEMGTGQGRPHRVKNDSPESA